MDGAHSAQSEQRAPERASTTMSLACASGGAASARRGGDDGRGGAGDHKGGGGDSDLDDDVVRQARSLQAQVERAATLLRPAAFSEVAKRTEPGTRLGARRRQNENSIRVSRRSAPRRTDAADVREPPAAVAACAAPGQPRWRPARHEARLSPDIDALAPPTGCADRAAGGCGGLRTWDSHTSECRAQSTSRTCCHTALGRVTAGARTRRSICRFWRPLSSQPR